MKPRHAAALVFVLLIVLSNARVAAQPPDFTALDAVVEQELKDGKVPGATLAIVSGGRVVYVKAYGTANVETGAPMTPDLLFRLGSTTKMFTAAAVVRLAEEGRIDLMKPVGDYIKGLHPSIARVTAHQLLSHTAGILDEAPMFGSHDETALTKNVLSWSGDRFFTEPARIYSYSNPGYWLAGALLEAVSGKLYADQMHESLFAPLGMTRTTLRPMVAMTYPVAQGHGEGPDKPVVVRPAANNAASWPAGSIFSNVQDLSRWVMAFVAGGRLDGREVLPPGVIARLSTPAAKIPGSDAQYGYGVNVGTYRGLRLVQHGGSRSGYGSTIRMVPEKQFGVVVLANRTGYGMPRTADKALEVVLALPAPKETPPAAMAPLTGREAQRYAGVYSQGGQKVEIVLKDGRLFVTLGGRETELRRTGEHRFTPGAFFVTGEGGVVEYLHVGGRSWKKVGG
jgi:CubicO group peptidase (beta-lactamase class C family)